MFNLTSDDVVAAPFPHAIKDGILSQGLFEALKREFPDDCTFDENMRHEWAGGRINLGRGNPIFQRFVRSSPAWREFLGFVNSPQFVAQMLGAFAQHMKKAGALVDPATAHFVDYIEPLEYSLGGRSSLTQRASKVLRLRGIYNRLKRLIDSESLYVTLDVTRSRGGYHIAPHTDNRYKLIVGLIYFNDVEELGGEGGDFVVHRHKREMPMSDYPRYPKDGDTEIATQVKPHANLGVFAINCNNSYHSTTPLKLENGYRKFLYVSIAQPYVNRAWT